MERKCEVCGKIFDGHHLSKYCLDCRDIVKRKQASQSQARKKSHNRRKIGSICLCERCGEPYKLKGAMQKYCADCAVEVRNERQRKKYNDDDEFRKKTLKRTAENNKKNAAVHLERVKKCNEKKRHEKIAAGKAYIKNVSVWVCKRCFAAYHPTSSGQKYCPICSKFMRLENMRLWRRRKKYQ